MSDPDTLITSLRSALPAAIKARDRSAVAALRTALAAIDHAQAVPLDDPLHAEISTPATSGPMAGAVDGLGSTEVPRRALSEAEVRGIVLAEIADRRESAARYRGIGKNEAASDLDHEADVLEAHLKG
jgi:uncharacterized protein YqeY